MIDAIIHLMSFYFLTGWAAFKFDKLFINTCTLQVTYSINIIFKNGWNVHVYIIDLELLLFEINGCEGSKGYAGLSISSSKYLQKDNYRKKNITVKMLL